MHRALGVLLGADEGKALIDEADAFLRVGGCVDPAHFWMVRSAGFEPR